MTLIRRATTTGLPLVAASLIFTLVGCSSATSSENAIAVTATDSTCEVASTNLEAGSQTFRVTNKGSDVTEVYVYAPGDKVIGEVENIGPGTSRDLNVSLAGGDFEVACKPGQKGRGIRTAIVVSGETAAPGPKPTRTIEVTAKGRDFTGLENFNPTPGETVEFRLINIDDKDEHELEFIGPDEVPVGEVAPLVPGDSNSVIITFDQSGTYNFLCDVDDHAAEGMKGSFDTAPDAGSSETVPSGSATS